jgi:hypothetical protein
MINGTMLTGSAALTTTATVDQDDILESAGVTIICEGSTLNSIAPEIKASNKGAASTLEFTKCSAAEPCKIASATVKSVPVILEATLDGVLAAVVTIKPDGGTVFTTIKFEGAECGLSGTTPIKGQVKVLLPTSQDERTLHLINAVTSAGSSELLLGNAGASLSGSALLRLASGQSWSFL